MREHDLEKKKQHMDISPATPVTSVDQVINAVQRKSNAFWMSEREKRSINLFHQAAQRVPAYRDFLKRNKINFTKINTLKDFENVPSINKDNYLKKYSLEKLCWDGSLTKPLVFTSTSGSTGEPFYFCRSSELDWQSSVTHELYFRNGFTPNASTLVLVCFGMGVWIGGLITYQAFELMSTRGYPVSILTPGINKEEIFKALRSLAPNFDQIILAGYPPFLKDIIDEASSRGIKLKDLNVRLLFAAEAFTENFRDYLCKKAGIANPLIDTMNIYGSADIGTMAFETPLSILIRKLAMKNKGLFEDIFSPISKTPTLAQYNPMFITFESTPDGRLLLTGDNSLPLIRYDIGDHGGVYSFNDLMSKCAAHGISLLKEAKAAGISENLYQLPFVYVYERADFSTTLYGLQIYPETIREILLKKPYSDFLTGKLTLVTRFDKDQNQYLEINLEMQRGKEASPILEKQLLAEMLTNLRTKNSEFRELSNYLKKRAEPKLIFWPLEDPLYFRSGIKQKWVKK